jgi:hypothetical protein
LSSTEHDSDYIPEPQKKHSHICTADTTPNTDVLDTNPPTDMEIESSPTGSAGTASISEKDIEVCYYYLPAAKQGRKQNKIKYEIQLNLYFSTGK